MTALRTLLAPAVIAAVLVVSGCAPTAPAPGNGGDGDGDTGGSGTTGGTDSGSASSVTCEGVTTAGWELFVDPRLTVTPTSDVVPLTAAGEKVSFTDTAPVGWTTYSYSLGYIDDAGTVFPNDSAIFVGAENTGTFEIEGPFAPSSVDGGPYAGVLQIEATDDAGTTALARICVALAVSD